MSVFDASIVVCSNSRLSSRRFTEHRAAHVVTYHHTSEIRNKPSDSLTAVHASTEVQVLVAWTSHDLYCVWDDQLIVERSEEITSVHSGHLRLTASDHVGSLLASRKSDVHNTNALKLWLTRTVAERYVSYYSDWEAAALCTGMAWLLLSHRPTDTQLIPALLWKAGIPQHGLVVNCCHVTRR